MVGLRGVILVMTALASFFAMFLSSTMVMTIPDLTSRFKVDGVVRG